MSHKVQLILGSTRAARISPQIAEWLVEQAKPFSNLEVEIVDLRDINLPFFDEPTPPSRGGVSTKPEAIAWSKKVTEAEGFIFLTPEYNAGYSAVMKNAIDYLYSEWKNKPALVVSYGFGGGASAQQQLIAVLTRIGFQVADPASALTLTQESFKEDGTLKDPAEVFAAFADEVKNSLTAFDALFSA